jgi:hypothetical protein
MSQGTDWCTSYRVEIAHAKLARQSGNEGKARVCARRAVGILLGDYLSQQGIPSGPSAYDRIRLFQDLPYIPPLVRQIIDHFLVHVNEDHSLPGDIDLLAEAEWLSSYFEELR